MSSSKTRHSKALLIVPAKYFQPQLCQGISACAMATSHMLRLPLWCLHVVSYASCNGRCWAIRLEQVRGACPLGNNLQAA